MSFLKFKVHFLFTKAYFYTYDFFSLILKSLFLQFFKKFHHGRYMWNLTSSLNLDFLQTYSLRLHLRILRPSVQS